MYKIFIFEDAHEHLRWFRKNDKQSYVKCFDLFLAITQDPRSGIGKPERLKRHPDEEVYSRRVNKKDRVVYTIHEDEKEVDITSFKGHYDDK